MRIPRVWLRERQQVDIDGRPHEIVAWGWSEADADEARRRARGSLGRIVERLRGGEHPDRGYGYLEGRPAREEIIEELEDDTGAVAAMVTRNATGALVLNVRDVAFIDVDVPAVASVSGLLRRLFGGPAPADAVLARIRAWAAAHPDVHLRVYRTAGGYRLLVLNRRIAAGSDEAERMLAELGSDPRYRRLCAAQESFRARLTPKHWRVGVEKPPVRFPFDDADAEARQRAWEERYHERCTGRTVCQLLEDLNGSDVEPWVQRIVAVHDRLACASAEMALA